MSERILDAPMEVFSVSLLFGYFLGCAFGMGCALAVMYSIFRSGYRTAIVDVMQGKKNKRYQHATEWATRKLAGKVTDRIW
jgi:hypothetical protein